MDGFELVMKECDVDQRMVVATRLVVRQQCVHRAFDFVGDRRQIFADVIRLLFERTNGVGVDPVTREPTQERGVQGMEQLDREVVSRIQDVYPRSDCLFVVQDLLNVFGLGLPERLHQGVLLVVSHVAHLVAIHRIEVDICTLNLGGLHCLFPQKRRIENGWKADFETDPTQLSKPERGLTERFVNRVADYESVSRREWIRLVIPHPAVWDESARRVVS